MPGEGRGPYSPKQTGGRYQEQTVAVKEISRRVSMSVERIREALDTVTKYLEEHPEKAQSTDTPAVATMTEGLRCRVSGPRGWEVLTDMPPALGGSGTAPSPGWLLRAAQASCDATLVAMEAARAGVQLTTLEVVVDSESDDRGLLGMDESIPPGRSPHAPGSALPPPALPPSVCARSSAGRRRTLR
jgi:hypothetical protein